MVRKDWVTFLVGGLGLKNIVFGGLDNAVPYNLRKLLNFPNYFDKTQTLNEVFF